MSSGTPDSPVGGDGVEPWAGSAAAARTGVIPSNADSGSGQDDSGQLSGSAEWCAIEALAALLEPEAFDPDQPADQGWRERTQNVAIGHAAKVITEGWRRVSIDDATVERVARAIWASKWRVPDATDRAWERAKSRTTEHHVAARTAVQALRDRPEQELKHHHECCPHCTARTGSCVRCGVRDSEDGEQLCGQCDLEVEAEALRDGSGT